MVLLGAIALATLLANSAARMRGMAAAFLLVALASGAIAAGATTRGQLAVILAAGVASAGILFVAARDARYGEDPGWRLWAATLIAAIATPVAFVSFRPVVEELPPIPVLGTDPAGVVLWAAAFWLLSSGIAILVTARRAVRMTLGALLMVTGAQLLMRSAPAAQLELTIVVAWAEVVIALAGAFLVVNERALLE